MLMQVINGSNTLIIVPSCSTFLECVKHLSTCNMKHELINRWKTLMDW